MSRDVRHHKFDSLMEWASRGVASRTTRRSLLGKTSAFMLMLLGQADYPVLPTSRRAMGQTPLTNWTQGGCTGAAGTSYDAKFCGLTGPPCSSCHTDMSGFPPNTDDPYEWAPGGGCPYVTADDNGSGLPTIKSCGSWVGCCTLTGGKRLITYGDCCAKTDVSTQVAPIICDITCTNQPNCDSQQRQGVTYCDDTCTGYPYFVCTAVSEITGSTC